MRTPEQASTYKPAHGGYPASRRRARVIGSHRGSRGPNVVVVNSYGAPPAPGFNRTAIEEAFALGVAAGGGRR